MLDSLPSRSVRFGLSGSFSKYFPVRDSSVLAEPWRRLLAATIDTTLLLLVHIAVVGYLICRYGSNDAVELAEAVGSPIVCWGYVLAGWSLGATFGMRVVGIKLVTEALGRVGAGTAVKRIVGFAVACLPVKAGLLPILYDARRQGWHDRIARTVVVKDRCTTADKLPDRLPSPALPPAPLPDMRAPWRASWFALPLYALLAVAMTWPTAAHLSTRIMGEKSDPYIFIWNYWYFLYALQTHHSPLSTNLIFYPHVVSLSLHTMQWFNCVLAAPLQRWLNLIAIYNVLNIASCAASAFAAYWCVAAITGKRLASLVTGVVFGLSPYFQAQGLGHANLVAAEFLPLYALCAYASLVTYRLRYALWAGLWMGLAGLCDLQYLAFSVLFGCVLFVGLWLYYERPDRAQFVRRIWLLIAGFIVAGLLLLPVIAPAIGQMGASSADKSHAAAMFRVDLADWVTPGIGSGLFGRHFTDLTQVEQCVTPGYTFLLLAFAGALLCWRRARLWCFAGLCFVVLASGPYLTVHGTGLTLISFLVAGFPGVGFGLPWQTENLVYVATVVVTDPSMVLSETLRIAMPYAWLPKVIPLFKPFRVPSRFGVLVLLCVAIVAALGLNALWERCGRRWRSASAVALACVAIACEFYCSPYPSYTPPSYPFYRQLAHDHGNFALIEEPFKGNDLSAYEQVFHHKPLFRSYLARVPDGAMDIVYRNPFLVHFTRSEQVMGSGGTRRALGELRRLGARYVVVVLRGDDQLSEKDCAAFERLTNAPVVYDDPSMRVYRIDGLR